MSEKRKQPVKWFNIIVVAAAAVTIVYLIVNNFNTFKNIFTVILGFGAVILIHEFGHFIVAKMSGIKVEAFSIGFPPVLIGIRKTNRGLRIRFLPAMFGDGQAEPKVVDASGESLTSKTLDKLTTTKPVAIESDTEYRIGLLPFGGFVKMLGQEDAGAVEKSDDPRSFANKPISIRVAVVAAGVIFNAISAFFIFLIVFMIGLSLPPAVVGYVQPGSPAAEAGIVAGDEIIEVDGESFVDFTSLVLAPALSSKGEEISFLVEHADGERETIGLVAEKSPMAAMPVRSLGLEQAMTLTVESDITDSNAVKILYDKTGFRPGDVVTAVDGVAVESPWHFDELVEKALSDTVSFTVKRIYGQDGGETSASVDVPLYWPTRKDNFDTEFDLCHVFSLVPRIKIEEVPPKPKPARWRQKIKSLFGGEEEEEDTQEKLQAGDIIVKVGDVENPTYEELRKVITEHKDKPMPITVLRTDAEGDTQLISLVKENQQRHGTDRIELGIVPSLDFEHAVVGSTIAKDGYEKLDIPRGATITAVDGESVSSFCDIVRIIRKNPGQRLSIEYRINEMDAGVVQINVPEDVEISTATTGLNAPIPFESLKKIYKAEGAVEAVSMGLKKTYMFIAQTYVTLSRLISRDVSPKTLMGPVGIVSTSYSIAKRDLIDYIYFLGLISSCIAVMNLLPLPIVDGGVIILLIIEKLKGSPLNERVQEAISYAGLIFILGVFLWLTYNDIMRILFQ